MHIYIYIYIYTYTYYLFIYLDVGVPGRLHQGRDGARGGGGDGGPALHATYIINCLHFSIRACHPCAGATLIFSVSFQF